MERLFSAEWDLNTGDTPWRWRNYCEKKASDRSSPEDRREGCLQVAHVGLHRRRGARLDVVSGLEVGLLVFTIHRHFASQGLLWVGNVLWERIECLVVAAFAWVGGLERFVMLHKRCRALGCCALWDCNVFTNHSLVRVEQMSLFGFLRERFFLHKSLACKSFLSLELLGSVIVILHVRDHSSECGVLANNTSLWWVS